MSYIGNTPVNQNFVAGADQFSGTGSQTVFTLSRNVNTVFDIFVTVSNVPQDPFTAYTVAGNTLTFDGAPPSGTNNIDVVYRATNVQTFVPSPGVSPSVGNLNFIGTGNRITGDFSNATVANRVNFQTSTLNSGTYVSTLPNGTDTNSGFFAYNATNGDNAAFIGTYLNNSLAIVNSGKNGTGTFLPMTFYTSGSERMRIDTSGNVGIGVVPSADWRTSDRKNLQVSGGAISAGETFTVLYANTVLDSSAVSKYLYNGTASSYAQSSVGHVWSTAASGTAGNTITFTESMRIASDGVITSSLGGMQVISGTSVSASGTAVNFTGIPSWVKKITVMLSGVSTNGTSLVQIQLGDSGGFETTGYTSVVTTGTSSGNSTTGFIVYPVGNIAYLVSGLVTLTNITSNSWTHSTTTATSPASGNAGAIGGGNKTLSDVLTQIRITTVNGTDTFDAGTINILYE